MPDPSTTSAEPERLHAEPVPDRVWTRPTFAFMKPRLSRWIALGFGSGLSRVAPGTVGTLWAWAVFVLLDPFLGPIAWGALIAASFVIGIWACERTGRDLGVSDHGGMVWDEVVAFWAVLVVVPGAFASQLAAFFLFRVFDVVKPPPIRQVDRRVKGGFGVMLDDAIAAFYTLLAYALWSRLTS
jgi:phosphatidylglycerophosphatase A